MESSITFLCLVAAIVSPIACYPHPTSMTKLTDSSTRQELYNFSNNRFKEPSQTDYLHPNSVYYDSKAPGSSTPETYSYNSNPSGENFANNRREIGSSDVFTHYTKERAGEVKESTPTQGKLYDALRELALTLEAIQMERQHKQQEQRRDGPPANPERPVFNVKSEKVPNFPPFTPELYPQTGAGPLSILEELSGSAGSLW